jgi:hypothetical protein
MHRCTAKFWTTNFLLMVMLLPAIGPLALARVAQPGAMHCMRKPLHAAAASSPAMHCHHEAAEAGATQNAPVDNAGSQVSEPASEVWFHALDNCCPNHDCCRGAVTSDWARPSARHVFDISLGVEPAPALRSATVPSASFASLDSARAPPRI